MNPLLSPDVMASVDMHEHDYNHCKKADAENVVVNEKDVRKYTRAELYLLRNEVFSRKRPKCALRSDLRCLGVWKFETGNASQNGNYAGHDSGNISNQSLNSNLIMSRGLRSPAKRDVMLVGQHTTAPGGSHQNIINMLGQNSSYIDHRSISSSHLMPAFVKKRIAATSQFPILGGEGNTSRLYNYENNSESALDRKDISCENQRTKDNDNKFEFRNQGGMGGPDMYSLNRKMFGENGRNRVDRKYEPDHLVAERERNSLHIGGNAKSNNNMFSNDRRIGSGRVLPRDEAWEYRGEREKNESCVADKELVTSAQQYSQQRFSGRFNERSHDRFGNIDRRSYDRKGPGGGGVGISGGSRDENKRDKCENSNNNSSSYATRNLTSNEIMNNNEMSMNQHQPAVQARSRRSAYNGRNEEPEWFSGGPTSQHDTIELRGFEDLDENFAADAPVSRNSNQNTSTPSSTKMKQQTFASVEKRKEKAAAEEAENFSADTAAEDKQLPKTPNTNRNNSQHVENGKESLSSPTARSPTRAMEKNVEQNGKDDFNFDTFLNLDSLEQSLVRNEELAKNGSSRFSRWFPQTKSPNRDIMRLSGEDEHKVIEKDQKSMLMNFIQGTNLPNSRQMELLHPQAIPSVEELEAKMMKIGSDELLNRETVENENKAPNTSAGNATLTGNKQSLSHNSMHDALTPAQDPEAFKKLLEQLGSGAQLTKRPPANRSNSVTPVNIVSAGGSGVPPLHISCHENEFAQRHIMLQQQQQHQYNKQLPPPVLIATQAQAMQNNAVLLQNIQTDGMMVPVNNPSQAEMNHFLYSVRRGDFPLSFLEQKLNSPSITPHCRDIIVDFLRENTKDMSSASFRGNPQPAISHLHAPHPMFHANHLSDSRSSPNPATYLSNEPLNAQQNHQDQENERNKAFDQHHEHIARRQELQKQQHSHITAVPQQTGFHSHHVNSPTPLAFTPTSVLRKMTADKDSPSCTQPLANMTPPIPSHQQQQSQIKPLGGQMVFGNQQHPQQDLMQPTSPALQPRMILGGNYQQQAAPTLQQQAINCGPQLSQHSIAQQLNQIRINSPMKWPAHMVNQNILGNKSIGRPILKGPVPAVMAPQQLPQMTFASKIELQQIQQQQRLNNQSSPIIVNHQPNATFPHLLQQQQHQQQSQNNMMQQQLMQPQMQQQQQRSFGIQRQQPLNLHHQQQQHQQKQHYHHLHQQQDINRRMDVGVSPPGVMNSTMPQSNESVGIINYQRDGGLSPTSNQLAQWFSPELLAQASAGKLPALNMNQTLSLEEFERSIQHSSAVHN